MSDLLSQEPVAPPAPPLPPRDQLSDHAYDGIQEYDNPTPGWWVAIFTFSVIFAVFYFIYYHSAVPDRSVYDRYGEDVAADAIALLARTQHHRRAERAGTQLGLQFGMLGLEPFGRAGRRRLLRRGETTRGQQGCRDPNGCNGPAVAPPHDHTTFRDWLRILPEPAARRLR